MSNLVEVYKFESFTLYPKDMTLFRYDSLMPLTPLSFRVLLYLVENANRIVSISEILDAVWEEKIVSLNSVPMRINEIRNVIGSHLIVTHLSKGYKFNVSVVLITEKDKESKQYQPEWITFDFPEEIKVYCEQYLWYFAKFLKDLGINAASNLKEEAGKVLFSFTSTDDVEALDKIREALAVYLKLPESPIVYDDSFAAMQLQQQIENLQHSQKMAVREIQVNEKLLLVQSDMIREKNVTISQQQTVIENQNKIIEKISSKSIMMDSVENKEELEEIYEGVKVGESKWLKELTGIGLNPAKAIKTAVTNTFGKDEKNSILGLNED